MLPLGKKVYVGGFWLLLMTRKIKKAERLAAQGITDMPKEIESMLEENAYPYLQIGTDSGIWKLEIALGHPYFPAFNVFYNEEKNMFEEEERHIVEFLLQRFYNDTSIIGDPQYVSDKMDALGKYLERQISNATDEQHEEAIREFEEMQEHMDTMKELAKEADNAEKEEENA